VFASRVRDAGVLVVTLAIVGGAFVACAPAEQGPLASGWHVRTVDSDGNTGFKSCLAIDSANLPHIAYYELQDPTNLKYARFDGARWIRTSIASGGDPFNVSLALDSLDRPHVAFMDLRDHDLRYARFDGTTWQLETVESEGLVGWEVALAIDEQDRPHLSYFRQGIWPNQAPADLLYAVRDGGAWAIETVFAGFGGGIANAIALDGLGHPHVVFGGPGTVHALRTDSGWKFRLIDREAMHYAAVAIDAANLPHVSYYHWWNEDVRYGWFDGASWQTESVVPAPQLVRSTAIALDAEGRPQVAFNAPDDAEVRYAVRDAGTWVVERVGAMSPSGHGHNRVSLQLDGDGVPSLSYYHERSPGGGELRYAFRVP
jgi:hypothetical protein